MKELKERTPGFRVKNLVLGIGIFIVFMLALWQGIEAFYPAPQYDQFCKAHPYTYPEKAGIAECTYTQQLRTAESECFSNGGSPIYTYNEDGCNIAVQECDYCNKELTDAQVAHNKIVFYIALIAGIITLLIGFAVLSIEPVGSSLMASGVGAIFYGTVRNWTNLKGFSRFGLLFLALALLIWIAMRLNKKKA